jgi:hypothetical protein
LPSILNVTPEQIASLQIIGAVCGGTRRKADAFLSTNKKRISRAWEIWIVFRLRRAAAHSRHHRNICWEIRPKLQAKKAREVDNAADALFGDVDDTIREAVQMVVGRKLSPEALTETCRAGLKAILE